MRKELEIMEIIDRYLLGIMSKTELETINARIATDSLFAEAVENQRQITEGIRYLGLKHSAAKAGARYHFYKTLKLWGGIALTVTTLVIIAFVLVNKTKPNPIGQAEFVKTPVSIQEISKSETAEAKIFVDTVVPINKKAKASPSFKSKPSTSDVLAEVPTFKPETQNPIQAQPNLIDFFREQKKAPKKFLIDPRRDTIIVGPEGTTIIIPAGALVLEGSGKVPTGKAEFFLTEYYSLPDILLADLSTTSSGNMLETGGMLYSEAWSAGERLAIKEGKSIQFGFPKNQFPPGEDRHMKLFSGNNSDKGMDWQLAEKVSTDSTMKYIIVESMPRFGVERNLSERESEAALMQYLEANLKYPKEAKDQKIEGTVYVEFTVNFAGKVQDVRIVRGLHPLLDSEAIRVISQMPRWNPGYQEKTPVNVSMILPVNFRLTDRISTKKLKGTNSDFRDAMVERMDPSDTITETGNFSPTTNLAHCMFFTSGNLNWINCDRFYRDSRPKTDLVVKLESPEQVSVKVIFDRIKSVSMAYTSAKGATIQALPVGEPVTILAMKYEGSQLMFATMKTKVDKKDITGLEFHPVTPEEMVLEMEKFKWY